MSEEVGVGVGWELGGVRGVCSMGVRSKERWEGA